MKKRALWKTALFLVLTAANVYVTLVLISTRTGESVAAELEGKQQTVAESPQVISSSGEHPPPDLPEAKPRVEILPPSPSVYDSVPEESLTTYVAKVNGDPVSVRLFERRLARNRFSAFQHFGAKYGAKPGADFWTTSYEGEVPAEWLKQRVLEECVRIKIELGLAREAGVISDTSYAAFLRALDKENERRRECLGKGEPIYGPKQYREDEFFLYVMNNVRIAAKRGLSQGRLYATEETLEEYYESVKDSYFDRGHRVEVWAIEIIYGRREGYPESLTRDEAKAKIEEAKRRLGKGERFEDVASEYNENGSLNHYVFDHETRSLDKSHRASKREEAMRLSEGEISDIYEEMNSFFILMCVEKERLGHEPYEEVRGAVKRHYIDAEYQSLVDERVKAAEVEVNSSVYEGIAVR